MLRKLSLVAVAAASLAAAALAPTSASAWGGHGWHGLCLLLRRLLCATIGPDAVGSPLAAGKSLLLISNRPFLDPKSPGSACRGFLFASSNEWNRPQRSLNFHWKPMQSVDGGKHFPSL
jgi:hypothetical protein